MAEGKTETAEQPQTIVYNDLKESHGAKAYEVYNKIANAGGFGSQGKDHIGADGLPTFPDLDWSGASDEAKKEISKLLKAGK